jgi:hypothetical protein
MVRPAAFGFKEETAGHNYFQQNVSITSSELQNRALQDVDAMVELLRKIKTIPEFRNRFLQQVGNAQLTQVNQLFGQYGY